jgi:hypothetical protein
MFIYDIYVFFLYFFLNPCTQKFFLESVNEDASQCIDKVQHFKCNFSF